MGFKFNTDLLTDEEDRKAAAKAYPKIFFALDHPELRDLFLPIDAEAGATKRRSQFIGFWSVIAVAAALTIASLAHIIDGLPEPFPHIIFGFGAACGIGGGLFGVFEIFISDARNSWLEKRYITERLRQLHFQTLILWAPEIVRAAQSGDHTVFLQARADLLEWFKRNELAPAAAKLSQILKYHADHDPWMVEARPGDQSLSGACAEELLQAIDDLRLTHQVNYAEIKLSGHTLSSPVKQVALFGRWAFWAVVSMLVLDIAALWMIFTGGVGAIKTMGVFDAGALCLAILALTMRALEEGYQSRREEERFRQYSSALRLVRRHFEPPVTDIAEKARALKALEEVCYEDLVNFLRGNDEARFLM